jgi:thymidylate synthase
MVYKKRLEESKRSNHRPVMNVQHTAVTLDDAWLFWYNELAKRAAGGSSDSRDGAVVGEIINATTVILNPTMNIMKNQVRKLPMRYMIGELLWYLSGNPSLDAIRNYTDAWDRMSDDGKYVNSNYGNLIQECVDFHGDTAVFNQYDYVKDLLKRDKNTRQAVIHIKTPRDTRVHPTKDLNCTVCLQFFIRDGALHMTTYMRSNDLWMGFPNDIFQFTCIQIRLAMELGVDVGYYTHIAGSLHLYERDYNKSLENMTTGVCTDGITTGRTGCKTPNVSAVPRTINELRERHGCTIPCEECKPERFHACLEGNQLPMEETIEELVGQDEGHYGVDPAYFEECVKSPMTDPDDSWEDCL